MSLKANEINLAFYAEIASGINNRDRDVIAASRSATISPDDLNGILIFKRFREDYRPSSLIAIAITAKWEGGEYLVFEARKAHKFLTSGKTFQLTGPTIILYRINIYEYNLDDLVDTIVSRVDRLLWQGG